MNYQGFLDSPQVSPGASPRQAPPSPQSMGQTNGMNGNMSLAGGMGYPTPAGHQADLNYIMSVIEALSKELATQRELTAGIVTKIGQVRDRAKDLDLSNDEMIALVAKEMNG